ncbi:hypothetical protein KP509_20G087500 [Ceratopteris richardii]|uniref:Auxin response factor n=1 Tax=Ceratopteris richardii TaxID=49495 RepID=A0A8T2SH62_CERRI|nr:hypothetical protein KP509_20G087500 [Ceratopteris richardii]
MDLFRQRVVAGSTAMATSRIPLARPPHQNTALPSESLSEELWQACAGSISYVPRVDERVWYFPQGHLEQVAASAQQESGCPRLPNSGLSPQILCRVINRRLSAEVDTDEVYAQISLVPEPTQSLEDSKLEEGASSPQIKSSTRLFIKILTASDTSTHGGFSVLRKHAEECLPPLDMTQETPFQDLRAKDLHGHEWKFRHTYRGHPRRHLLTTGWSMFVSQKKLVAGDAVIFLRGENGDLMVGIRRAKRPQNAPQAVMSSQSMYMGVIATAQHAVLTRTIFSVFFKPRVSLSSFLVPESKLSKTMSTSFSVGMRFQMQFDTDDACDRSFTGTITGIEDLDGENWIGSKWRSLKVEWDESCHERPSRVSPWEIEPASSSSSAVSPTTLASKKRFRPSHSLLSQIAEFSGPGSSKEGALNFPIVLQGQEIQDKGVNSFWRSQLSFKSPVQEIHQPSPTLAFQHHSQQEMEASSLKRSNRAPYHMFTSSDSDSASPTSFNIQSCNGLGHSQGLIHDNRPGRAPTENVPVSGIAHFHPSFSSNTSVEQQALHTTINCLFPTQQSIGAFHSLHPSSQSNSMQCSISQYKTSASAITDPFSASEVSSSGIKLFGFSLMGKPNAMINQSQDFISVEETDKIPIGQPETQIVQTKKLEAGFDQERIDCHEAEARSVQSTRSCIKVIKKGSMVGRGVDLSRFEDYASLFHELEKMFNMKGELTDTGRGWQVVYSDEEGDTMKVGDDPWPEFCNMVRKLYILSPEGV